MKTVFFSYGYSLEIVKTLNGLIGVTNNANLLIFLEISECHEIFWKLNFGIIYRTNAIFTTLITWDIARARPANQPVNSGIWYCFTEGNRFLSISAYSAVGLSSATIIVIVGYRSVIDVNKFVKHSYRKNV